MISAQEFLAQHGLPEGNAVPDPLEGPEPQKPGERATDAGNAGDVGIASAVGITATGAFKTGIANDASAPRTGKSDSFDPQDFDACREAAFRLLDAAPRSTGSLRQRLADKGYAEGTVDDVIDRLIELHLLDDEAYARSVVRYCVNRMMGYRGAVMEMRRKGVAPSLAHRVADEAAAQGAFEEAAWELGRKVARKTRGLDGRVRMRRFWSAGGRKGHDSDTLRRVAHELLNG
ncbi:RecX family transcriptional regulator [Bifidobacterium sp. 64T4]|uniref:regulatory protein RecX n=1 Tax=Bifidobacterium pongonis TaxID=2834432 RepID=UPI001C57AB02|nr:regulatory protein RecX [Bifidobacterium pongonis]MBW3095241.1 RecX family transcriptional regulator [Bifidobacterium pongonis]